MVGETSTAAANRTRRRTPTRQLPLYIERGWQLVACLGLAACGSLMPCEYPSFDPLEQVPPQPPRVFDSVAVSEQEYALFRRYGEEWFRGETLGNERLFTDVIGLLNGEVEVPCAEPARAGCYRSEPVLRYVLAAIDALDGVSGNLFAGNGGPTGSGVSSNLVLHFPKGTRLLGTIPVPEYVALGLDVEAGSPFPIGVVPIPAPAEDQFLPYLIDPAALGFDPAPTAKVRFGLSCAVCHYSLDIDWDGKADLYSAWTEPPAGHADVSPGGADQSSMPGSRFRPRDAHGIGNQDINLGWIIALSKNPLAAYLAFSAPLGGENSIKASRAWATRVRRLAQTNPIAATREIIPGLLAQPAGSADDTPDARHNPTQLPVLFTYRNWPYNVDGSQLVATDRNNSVWTIGLEFSSLVAATRDRGGHVQSLIHGRFDNPYFDLEARELAELMLSRAPRVEHDPAQRELLIADILGESDGVPGLLNPENVVVLSNACDTNLIPKAIVRSEQNRARLRDPEDFGPDGEARARTLAATGIRVITPPHLRRRHRLEAYAARGMNIDEFMSNTVSLMLDSLEPPQNHSPLIQDRALVKRGHAVFVESGCADCHRGPMFTDNLIYPAREIGSSPDHSQFTRELRIGAPAYDPKTGRAEQDSLWMTLGKLLSRDAAVGIKTATLRYVWGSAPYLHDGSVGVALQPGLVEGADLQALLSRPAQDKIFGMGRVYRYNADYPALYLRANAALSLQALLLKAERARVIEANRGQVLRVPGYLQLISMWDLGVRGRGHDYYIDDRAGGPRISALVAFLLALDDNPGDIAQPTPAAICQ